MKVYYNDFDPGACAWTRELIAARLVTDGMVDERSIRDVRAEDLVGFNRCHFFSGICGWEYALQLAGWPDDRVVWSGSCPCQPFSAAGKGKGEADERHLWPAWFSLIRVCRPDCIFGEQVGGSDGYRWLDGVRTDLESQGYAFGAADLPAACVGAPHIRQRLFWVAKRIPSKRRRVKFAFDERDAVPLDPDQCHVVPLVDGRTLYVPKSIPLPHSGCAGVRRERQSLPRTPGGDKGEGHQRERLRPDSGNGGESGNLPDARQQSSWQHNTREGVEACDAASTRPSEADGEPGRHRGLGEVPNADGRQSGDGEPQSGGQHGQQSQDGGADEGRRGCFWGDFDIIHFADGKARRVEPGTFPLAHGVSSRLVKLRGYGNAIVPQVAAKFIRAFLEVEGVTL